MTKQGDYNRILVSAHKKVLSESEKTALMLLTQYVTDVQGVLFKNTKYGDILVRRAKADLKLLRYQFRATSLSRLNNLIEKAIGIAQTARGQGYKAYFDSIDPAIMASEAGQGVMQVLFGGGFSDGIRKIIEQRRKNMGLHLSKSIWNYTKQGEEDIWKAVYDGLQNDKTMVQIGNSVKKYLTAKGRANMAFNLKRLIITETNSAYLSSQQYITQHTPWITKVRLYRGPDGDPKCPICLDKIGPVGTSVVRDAMLAEYPPYHPFCKCGYVDVLPTKAEMIAYLRDGKPLITKP